jgi:hypothetical protein
MKPILIEIDTNGDNFDNYTNNLELYDLITPQILFLLEDGRIITKWDEIDWERTRKSFTPPDDGHCIWTIDDGSLASGGYISARGFSHIGILVDDDCNVATLSQLCDMLAEKHGITSWLETRNK